MRLSILVGLIALQMTATGCAEGTKKVVGGGCDGCELMFEGMPKGT